MPDELPKIVELKPCPFCGESPRSYWQSGGMDSDCGYWAVECRCGVAQAHEDDEQTAVERWNTRTASGLSEALERERRLREALEAIADGEGDADVIAQQTLAALNATSNTGTADDR